MSNKEGIGRPKIYSPELGRLVCDAIATSSDTLPKLCATNPDFPSRRTICRWRIEFPEFQRAYVVAKQHQVEVLVDEMLDIADDTSHDDKEIERDDGSTYIVCNTEWIARSKVRIDIRRWLATKLSPQLYGDKLYNENNLVIRHEDALKELE
jgi:hypothetical protein